ncbi:MAG: hypothetical protein IPK59_19580 [Rhodospirillaceae bacterium]|nr:hypothetical protein [Rhodospirillaceae bacterium]
MPLARLAVSIRRAKSFRAPGYLEKSGYLILAGDFSASAKAGASHVVSVRRRGEALPLLFLTFSKRPVDAVTSLYWQPGGWEIEATDLCLDPLEHSLTRH